MWSSCRPKEVREDMDTFRDGEIEGVLVRPLEKYKDARGWLCELFRRDEADESLWPAMCYASMTSPGVTRGPHEHVDQADWFCFIGPSNFRLELWDNRPDSPTYQNRVSLEFGQSAPASVIVPAGVVHGYRNVGTVDGLVINLPNRLYRGEGRKEEVDEIRHEVDPGSRFRMRA